MPFEEWEASKPGDAMREERKTVRNPRPFSRSLSGPPARGSPDLSADSEGLLERWLCLALIGPEFASHLRNHVSRFRRRTLSILLHAPYAIRNCRNKPNRSPAVEHRWDNPFSTWTGVASSNHAR